MLWHEKIFSIFLIQMPLINMINISKQSSMLAVSVTYHIVMNVEPNLDLFLNAKTMNSTFNSKFIKIYLFIQMTFCFNNN